MKKNTIGILISSTVCLMSGTVHAQGSSDFPDIQDEADAAFQEAQDQLMNTDGLFLFQRSDASDLWSIIISGTVADNAVDYTGDLQSILLDGENYTLITNPPLPAFAGAADLGGPMLRAAANSLHSADDALTELSFHVSALLKDTADPQRLDGVDIDTLPRYTLTTKITHPKAFHLIINGPNGPEKLPTVESYSKLVSDYKLSTDSASKLLSGALDSAGIDAAFRQAAVDVLAQYGISENSAIDVYNLRKSLGDTDQYYQQAFALLAGAGEPLQQLLDAAPDLDGPDVPLTTIVDSRDVTISLDGRMEVTVSVPPFVSVTVEIKATVSGTVDEYAEMQAALDVALAEAGRQAKKAAEEQLEFLKDSIQDLVDQFESFLADLDVPGWIRWLF